MDNQKKRVALKPPRRTRRSRASDRSNMSEFSLSDNSISEGTSPIQAGVVPSKDNPGGVVPSEDNPGGVVPSNDNPGVVPSNDVPSNDYPSVVLSKDNPDVVLSKDNPDVVLSKDNPDAIVVLSKDHEQSGQPTANTREMESRRKTSLQHMITSSPRCRHESISSDHPTMILLSSPSNESVTKLPPNPLDPPHDQVFSSSEDDYDTCVSDSELSERALLLSQEDRILRNISTEVSPSSSRSKYLPPLSNSAILKRIMRRNTSSPEGSATSSTVSLSLTESFMSTRMSPLLTSYLRMRCLKPTEGFDSSGQLESCFPDRCIRLHIVTWNMYEIKDLPKSLSNLLLPLHHDFAADMFVIGTQESTPSKKDWELLIQQTLGPSYVLIQSASLGVLYLCFFLRRDLIWFCSAIHTNTFATRPVTMIKTKGAVAVSFTLFGSSFIFITSHFCAGDLNAAERNNEMKRISSNLIHDTEGFDYTFWFGDMNYRVDLERDVANEYVTNNDWMSLLVKDQLTKEILQGNVFPGYSEQPVSFPPSYKFDLNSDKYDTSEKQRVPSWTDRILFKSRTGSGVNGCEYSLCDSLKCSDHRAVYGVFRVKLEPSYHIEGIPENIANFDREIYVQANKQRKVFAEQITELKTEEVEQQGQSSTTGRKIKAKKKVTTSQFCLIL